MSRTSTSVDILNPELKQYGTERQGEYLDAAIEYGSATKAAKALGVNPRTVQRGIAALKRAAIEAGAVEVLQESPRILLIDIETAPNRAFIWRMFEEVRNIDMMESDWYILSWSAKWYDQDEIITKSQRMYKGYHAGSEDDKNLIRELSVLLDEADFVVGHNGDKFDIKKINTRMLMHGFRPVTPYRSIDTMKMAKRVFGFTSNKLDWLAWSLFRERKLRHDGFELWKRVLNGDKDAWELMEDYNAKDVDLLERVYTKLRPWDHLHPNINLATNKLEPACTACGSTNIRPTNKIVTVGRTGTHAGYECVDCGHQMRGRTNIRTKTQATATLMSAK